MSPVTNRLAYASTFFLFPLYFLWRKTRKGTIAIVLAALIFLSSCFQHYFRSGTRNSVDGATLKRLHNSSKYFIIHYSNNKVFGLNNVIVNGDNVEGDLSELTDEHKRHSDPSTNRTNRVKRADKIVTLMEVHLYYPQPIANDQTRVSIPLSAVNRMDVYEFDRNATTGNHIISWIGVGVASAFVIGLIAFAIACNCPQVYVNNNGQYEFKSGVYSGAVYSTLERSDYLYLDGIQPVNNKYQFRIGNVENEEQFINQVQLLKADHPADVKVLADRHGKILSYQYPVTPAKATYDNDIDITGELKYKDASYYSFDSKPADNGLSAVVISFDKPANAQKGKLIVHAGNSKWSGYLYKEFASLFGEGYTKWRDQQEQLTTANADQWQIDQGLPLKVFAETENGWQYMDHFALTGNTASRDMIMEIDLSSVKTSRVNIKIESTFRFWDMDMAAMDFSDNFQVKTTFLTAVSVNKKDGTSNLDELARLDKKYTQLTGKDFVNLEFNVASADNGNTTSLFLISTGYYHSQYSSGGKPDLPSLMKFKEKGAFDRFSRTKYTLIEESLAKAVVK